MHRMIALWLPEVKLRCRNGQNLARPLQFEQQKTRAAEVLSWYDNYVVIKKRLESGFTPTMIDGFCKQGAVSAGVALSTHSRGSPYPRAARTLFLTHLLACHVIPFARRFPCRLRSNDPSAWRGVGLLGHEQIRFP